MKTLMPILIFLSGAGCSYVMVGQKNVPYPQVDTGFSREDAIECN